MALVSDFVIAAGSDPDLAVRVAIVVEELICNIIDHGRVGDGAPIGLSLELGQAAVTITVTDTGRFHDPRVTDDLSAVPPDEGGGAGLRLVRAWSRILAYDRIGGTNRLVLEVPCPGAVN